ncbi:MAG: beta-propeller domain-containing protein, partial [Polyangiaceae bacterium]
MASRRLFPASLATLTALVGSAVLFPACGGGSHNDNPDARVKGQTSFQSAPPGGSRGGSRGSFASDGAGGGALNAGAAAPTEKGSTPNTQRKVEETDLYRVDGDRLYYLNSYRGLMVFDITNVDQPKLLGRSPIFGTPVEMIVRNGVATVVVADWYGRLEDGSPFHGSIVRGIDASDPANIKTIGEARLGGWVRDTRVVGDVLYAVSEDYGWYYGIWDYGYGGYGGGVAAGDGVAVSGGGISPVGGGGNNTGPKVVVSSVSFGGGAIQAKGLKEFSGYSAIFNVTPTSIMLAHDIPSNPSEPYSGSSGKSELQYIDITDPGGNIALRGKATVNGSLSAWGTDNGRWNLDFADGVTAHVLGCNGQYCGNDGGYELSTVDFTNPDAPTVSSDLNIPGTGWSVAARFDGKRMYLSPSDGYYGGGGNTTTPIQIYDLSVPASPKLAGATSITGNVWNFIPAGNKLFALGNDSNGSNSSQVSLRYLDVTDAAHPAVLGTSSFGDGWAWTPAQGTFKAFIKDDAQGLVVLPFSGWSDSSYAYNNGVQLIEFTPTTIRTAGAAKTHGWVERGILAKGRVLSLSDLALSVVDYSDRNNPRVVNELTLARNVVSARPQGGTISELSSDWWENDSTTSEMRVLPIANADETTDSGSVSLKIDGINARAFRNGDLAYVVTNVRTKVPCNTGGVSDGTTRGPDGTGGAADCYAPAPQIQVVDLANGQATPRGKITLPINPEYYGGYWGGFGWGWGGYYWYDWYDGSDAIQIQGDVLAFRRWSPIYTDNGKWRADQSLYVVDLKNPDAPTLASTLITEDDNAWWGNMRAVGDKLYTTHYEWIDQPLTGNGVVKYYLDQIDLSDRAHPRVGAKINVPGLLVGASETDPSLLYTVDYRWDGTTAKDEISVVKIDGGLAYLQSTTQLDGYVGNVFVRGNTAYMSSEKYVYTSPSDGPRVTLHQLDLTSPTAPVDHPSASQLGWGWLLGIEGDRAILTSGWGNQGVDIYKLNAAAPPAFDQFVRTRGWWTESLARQN